MKTLEYVGAFNHRRLYGELRAAIDGEISLSGAVDLPPPPGEPDWRKGVFVGVPDDTDETNVAAVISAHDPEPDPPGVTVAAIEERVADAAAAAVGAVLPFVAPGATPADMVAAQDAARDAARGVL